MFKLSIERLACMTTEALAKEKCLWKSLELSSKVDSANQITYHHREENLKWLQLVSDQLQFYPEASALAVAILDKFLSTVKAKPRYLKCIALTCFHLAAKITEEDEVVPCLSDLVRLSCAGCSTDDIIRMERIVLTKLSWNINLSTSLHFLQLFHARLMLMFPTLLDMFPTMTPSHQLNLLTRKLQQYTRTDIFCQSKPSVVALSLLSLELEKFRQDWFPVMLTLMKDSKVEFADLISCRETMTEFFASQNRLDSHHQSVKRKMEEVVEQDDIYDSIKKLYSDEGPPLMLEPEC